MRDMPLTGDNQQMEQYSTATSSQPETCEDHTWFSSDIAMLCGGSGGSDEKNLPLPPRPVSTEESGMDDI